MIDGSGGAESDVFPVCKPMFGSVFECVFGLKDVLAFCLCEPVVFGCADVDEELINDLAIHTTDEMRQNIERQVTGIPVWNMGQKGGRCHHDAGVCQVTGWIGRLFDKIHNASCAVKGDNAAFAW